MKCLCLTPQQLTVATGSRTISALLWSLLRILEKLTVRYNSNDKTSSPTDCAFDRSWCRILLGNDLSFFFWSTNAHFFLSPLTFLMYPTQPYSFQITNINFFVKRLSFSFLFISLQVLVQDLLHPTAASEARKHKLKTLVQGPRSII